MTRIRAARWRIVFAAFLLCVSIACAQTISTTDLSLVKWPDGTALTLGQAVIVHQGGTGPVGLWLIYEDRCETDITYTFVPAGTRATLAGLLCSIDDVWYVKVAFTDGQRRQYEVASDNTWLPLAELSRSSAQDAPAERSPEDR